MSVGVNAIRYRSAENLPSAGCRPPLLLVIEGFGQAHFLESDCFDVFRAEQWFAFGKELAGVHWPEVAASLKELPVGVGFELAVILVYDLLLTEVPC